MYQVIETDLLQDGRWDEFVKTGILTGGLRIFRNGKPF